MNTKKANNQTEKTDKGDELAALRRKLVNKYKKKLFNVITNQKFARSLAKLTCISGY